MGGRWRRVDGGMEGWGWGATMLLSMTPNKTTEIGAGGGRGGAREERLKMGEGMVEGEAGECICEWRCLDVRSRLLRSGAFSSNAYPPC